ncbi:MAG TPA: type II secretion system protein N [Pseudomonadales bacterium]|nr:type II secretion system protein N [Pseudomonadales bacterium]
MRKWTVALGVLVFFATLVTHAPARLLPALTKAAGVELSLLSVEGSLWQGRLQGMQISMEKRDWFVEAFAWQIQPLALLGGHLCMDITEGRGHGISARGELCVNQSGDIQARELVMTAQVGKVLALASFPLPVDGDGSLNIKRLNWQASQGFDALEGAVFIKDYAYQVNGQREVLGDYQLNIAAPEASILALTFMPSNAKIALQGGLSVQLSGEYEADLQFIPSPEASQALVESLRFVAVKQEDNSYRFKYSGRL